MPSKKGWSNRGISALGVLLLAALVAVAQGDWSLGSYRLSSGPSSAPLQYSLAGSGGLGSYDFVSSVGGVAFTGIAMPHASLQAKEIVLHFDKTAADGHHLQVTLDGATATADLPDWMLIPIARFADTKFDACVSLFGPNTNEQAYDIVYHQSFRNTLLGMRLLQADMMLFDLSETWHLPQLGGVTVLGIGETAPRQMDEASARAIEGALGAGKFQSWVMTDRDEQVIFTVNNGSLELTGTPYYYFWTSNDEEVQAAQRRLAAEADQLRKAGRIAEHNRIVERINAMVPTVTEVTSLTQGLRNSRGALRRFNTPVYDAAAQTMRYSAFFRYAKTQNPKGWADFLSENKACRVRTAGGDANPVGKMREAAFLSYAEEDAVTALRIHQALSRSGMTVWGYLENGRIGVDFRGDFREQIRTSRYFCLLDSRSSRLSKWIKEECALAQQANAIKVICRIEACADDEEWRRTELFEDQNYISGIDFKTFETGIHRLCEHLGIAYTPGFRLARDQDFAREVFEAGIDDRNHVEELHDLYHEFREQYADREFAEAQLRIIIRKCQRYGGTNVVSPTLALGVMMGDAGRHREAIGAFRSLTESHPQDPRGWAGLGGACFHLGLYEQSLAALGRAEEAILKFYPGESADHLPEVLHNIASALLLLDRADEAWAVLHRLSGEQRKVPYIQALEGRLLLAKGSPAAALGLLEGACDAFRQQGEIPPDLMRGLADCYRQLGRRAEELELMKTVLHMVPPQPDLCHRAADCFLQQGSVPEAVEALRKATESLPDSPRFRAQFAAVLHQRGNVAEALLHAEECVRSGLSPQERYYRGLAYYLLGQNEGAAFDFAESRKDPVVAKWPHYAEGLHPPAAKDRPMARWPRAIFGGRVRTGPHS